jgi:hypothetical protein
MLILALMAASGIRKMHVVLTLHFMRRQNGLILVVRLQP